MGRYRGQGSADSGSVQSLRARDLYRQRHAQPLTQLQGGDVEGISNSSAYPPAKRSKQSPAYPALTHLLAVSGGKPVVVDAPDPSTFLPAYVRDRVQLPALQPYPALPVVASSAASDFLPEENALLLEARGLGKPWSEIGRMIPDKSMKALKRQLTALQKPKDGAVPSVVPIAPSSAGPSAQPSSPLPALGSPAGGSAPPPRAPVPQEPRASPAPKAPLPALPVQVNQRATGRAGGDARVRLARPLSKPPKGTTVLKAHQLPSFLGVKFFEEVTVTDPDSDSKAYLFSLTDPEHCACFNIGEGPDGSPLISWSDLLTLYQLPDGTKWAEHGSLYDIEDLEAHAAQQGRDPSGLLQEGHSPQELFRRAGRYHSRLQNIEEECWVYRGQLPSGLPGNLEATGAYFWRKAFHPLTLKLLQG